MYTVLARIPIYKITGDKDFQTLPISAEDDYSFTICSPSVRLVFVDEKIKLEENGDAIIQLGPLHLERTLPNVDLPKTATIPAKVLQERAERRRVAALENYSIYIDRSVDPILYYYLEKSQLRVKQGDKEVIVSEIVTLYGRYVIEAEGLELESKYLELPNEVKVQFEAVIKEEKLKGIHLESVGLNLLTMKESFRFVPEAPDYMMEPVRQFFEYYEDINGYIGLVTD